MLNTYIAFLRAINVGGYRKIKMLDLRDMFEMMIDIASPFCARFLGHERDARGTWSIFCYLASLGTHVNLIIIVNVDRWRWIKASRKKQPAGTFF